ncbi:MAG: TldD/PmbA family protein [Myxococcales bacterium]|nr:TldD/PmbA family protein [Myxococcales bacterium]
MSGFAHFASFGVTPDLVRAALHEALCHGGESADVFVQSRVNTTLALEDGEVNRAYASVDAGLGVRVVRGDQQGYGYTEDFSEQAVRRAAQTAAAIAEGPARPGPVALTSGPLPDRYRTLRPWEDVAALDRLPVLRQLNAAVLAADPRIVKCSVTFRDESSTVLIVDGQGRVAFDRQPMTVVGVTCVAEHSGRRESNSANVAGRAGFEFYTPDRLERVARQAVERTLILFDAAQPPAGEMPVVLGAGSSGILLHEAIGHGLEADFNRKNISIYSDKMGKAIAQPLVTIVDDATLAGARGSINVDDEGNAAGRTVLVDRGVLVGYLHDGISARHYGVQPTGNGRRESFRHLPMPRMRATYMEAGPHDPAEIIASVARGIYCETFANGQVQIGAGDFTFFVKNGWLIEGGKLTRPIKDVNLIGNGPRVLEQVDMVGTDLAIDEGGWTCGKDGQSVPVSQGMPTVRVRGMTVGGRAA